MNNNFSHNVILELIEELKRDSKFLSTLEISPAQAEMEIKGKLCSLDIEPMCAYSGALMEENQTIFLQTTSSHILEKLQDFLKKMKEQSSSDRSETKQEAAPYSSEEKSSEFTQGSPEASMMTNGPANSIQPDGDAPKIERFNPADLSAEKSQSEGLNNAIPSTYAPLSPQMSAPTQSSASPMNNGRFPKFSISIPKSKLDAYKNDPTKDKNTVMFELMQMIDNQLRTQFINPNAVYKNVNFNYKSSFAVGQGKPIGRALADIFYAEVYGYSKSKTMNEPAAPAPQQTAPVQPIAQQGFPQTQVQSQTAPVPQSEPVTSSAAMGQGVQTPAGTFVQTTEMPTNDFSVTAPTSTPMRYSTPAQEVGYSEPTTNYTGFSPATNINPNATFDQTAIERPAYSQEPTFNISPMNPTDEITKDNFKSFNDKVLLDALITDTRTNGNMPSDLYNDIMNYLISAENPNNYENAIELNNNGLANIPVREMSVSDDTNKQ